MRGEAGCPKNQPVIGVPSSDSGLLPSGYSFGALADAVARGIERDEPVAVLGHSLGGVVGAYVESPKALDPLFDRLLKAVG